MCDPLTLTGLALSAGGGALKAKQNASYVNAVNAANKNAYDLSQSARERERVRQAGFDQEADAAYRKTVDQMGVDNFEKNRSEGVDAFLSMFDETTPEEAALKAPLPGQEGASVDVKDNVAAKVNKASVDARNRAKALAEVSGYGLTGADRGRTMAGTGDTLSTLGGLRRGSLAVANQEQDVQPATVTQGGTLLPDLLTGAGNLIGYGGSTLFDKLGLNIIGAAGKKAAGGGLASGQALFGEHWKG